MKKAIPVISQIAVVAVGVMVGTWAYQRFSKPKVLPPATAPQS
jgi:hypothetical protein